VRFTVSAPLTNWPLGNQGRSGVIPLLAYLGILAPVLLGLILMVMCLILAWRRRDTLTESKFEPHPGEQEDNTNFVIDVFEDEHG
jgi:hypothetical protein